MSVKVTIQQSEGHFFRDLTISRISHVGVEKLDRDAVLEYRVTDRRTSATFFHRYHDSQYILVAKAGAALDYLADWDNALREASRRRSREPETVESVVDALLFRALVKLDAAKPKPRPGDLYHGWIRDLWLQRSNRTDSLDAALYSLHVPPYAIIDPNRPLILTGATA